MKLSLRTKFFIIIFPLLIITIYLLITAIIPHLEINKDLKHIKLHISSLITGQKFARFFNLQVNEYAELILTGTIKEEQEMDETQKMVQSLMIEWRKELQREKDNNERRINLGMLDNIEKRYNDVTKLSREFIELINNGTMEQALGVFEELEVLLEGFILVRMERLIDGEEEKAKEYLMHVYNHTQHMTFLAFQGLSSAIRDIQQDIRQVVLAERFARLFIWQVREYADFILVGKTIECRVNESREVALITLNDWKEEIKKEFEEDERERELYDFAEIEKEYFSVSENGQKIIELIKEGKQEQAIRIFIEEIKPSLGNVILATIDKYVQEGHAEIRKDLSRLAGTVALMNFILGFSIFIIGVIGIGVPWLLSRKIVTPILKLKEVITRVGTGEFETRVEIPSGDELGELAESFNKMTENLGSAVAAKEKEITKRKRGEEELAKTKNRLSYLQKSTSAILYTCATTGNYAATYITENIYEQLGYTQEEFLSSPDFWATHLHPEDRERVFTGLEDILKKGHLNYEYRFLHKNGTYIWLSDESNVMYDAAGNPAEIVGYIINISERKKAEKKIKMFSDAIAGAIDGTSMVDLNGLITYTNPAMEKLYGYNKGEMIGKHVSDLTADPDIVKQMISTLMKTDSWDGEVLCQKKNKETFPAYVSLSTIKDEDGKPLAMMGINRDITKYKNMMEELHESEDKYRKLFSTDKYPILVFDSETFQYIDVNEAALKLYGYSREEFFELKVEDISAEEEKTAITIKKVIKGDSQKIPLRYHKKKDGTVFPVEILPGSFTVKDRRLAYGIIRDLSERKKAEQERERLQQQLIQSEKMASLGEMGAGFAHELNTPLNVILGYQELMQKKIAKCPEFKEYVDISVEQVEFCSDLIQDFLMYAQPSRDKMALLDSVDIAEIVNGIIKLVPQHKEQGINIKIETKENLPLIKGNQKQLTQLFVNLVNNAIHAMSEGGDLVISTRLVKHDQKEGGNGEMIEFLIHDTGEGIPKENIIRVFDPFFTTKRPGRGTGLGLAVCLRIIKNHKGTIRIESEPGRGTTVIGQLPV